MELVHSKEHYRLATKISCTRGMQPMLDNFIKTLRKSQPLVELEYSYPSSDIVCANFQILLPFEFEVVVELVCTNLELDKKIVVGNYKIKNRRVVLARECIVGIMRYKYKYPVTSIAELMGMCNHSLVVRMCHTICEDKLPNSKETSLADFYTFLKKNHRHYQKVFLKNEK